MKRKLAQAAFLLLMLSCLMGATISFDAGQPKPNPGGQFVTLEGKGTYAPGQDEILSNFAFSASNTKKVGVYGTFQSWGDQKWSSTLNPPAGNYDVKVSVDVMNMKTQKATVAFSTANVDIK